MSRVVIIGGGIAGLSAAYYLEKNAGCEIVLLESGESLGGKVSTVHEHGLLIEQGPDSIFSSKPAAVELMQELGLASEMTGPLQSEFSILTGGSLHAIPRALASLMPTASSALEKVAFLGAAAKRRVLAEKSAPKGSGADESVASFFRRRFGKRFSAIVAEPLLAGTHAGDPERLSMKALYPTYLGLEQKNGSLTAHVEAHVSAPSGSRPPAFVTLKMGMGGLIQRLVQSLTRTKVVTQAQVTGLSMEGAQLRLSGIGFESLLADHLVLAAPSYAAADLLQGIAPAAAQALSKIRHVSTAIASFAYSKNCLAKPPLGNGFLVPGAEPCDITGCTWSSNKWPCRAPEDVLLLRAFMGRDGGMNVDEFADEELLAKATAVIERILQPAHEPTFRRIDRWTRAMPQYDLGHLDLLAEIERPLAGLPIHLIGSSYRGVGIPDCIRQGRETAEKLTEALGR